MSPAKLARFADADRYFRCPVCGELLSLDGTSLRCANRHTFDIARQGYVNLAPGARQSAYYDRGSFLARGAILRAGYYDHIRDAVLEAVGESGARRVLDAGCGEGFYARAVQAADPSRDVLAFDISRDCVQLAAREDTSNAIRWFVGNLAQLPLADRSIDCVLDIFSPANHAEFTRVLAPGGLVVKAVPGARHDIQLREAARDQLRHADYANDDVLAGFAQGFDVVDRRLVSRTVAMPPEDVQSFARMTPLLFHADLGKVDLAQVHELTIEAEVLIGRVRA
ncbi:putative RNA methyltransferase [Bifidobacterium cuniculi]|uniref:rRNA (Guanine-N1-)-methyltransferase n=1 Tax=Bifidobacterium cuniculi TaxID=1688 RepID=A0A087ATE8_9BIFI|nr:methyltransferase domain-containing protein [Bifidobacterium cuniculi]KFI62048.1 rRNA (Guanine-N1-)-methyltransferase [Bifidobacterium cuniculi]